MRAVLDFLLVLLGQFAGGSGRTEDNLVRFGLAAVFWAALLVVAWSRQRGNDLPREKLLVWGFGLGLARELFMFSFASLKILNAVSHESLYFISAPLEHLLSLAALVVIAASFLRYILDDRSLSHRYLRIGLGAAAICYLATSWWWASYITANPGNRFNQTWCAWLFHVTESALIAIPIFLLRRKRGWLRNIVLVALTLFFLSRFVMLFDLATGEVYRHAFCPISNSFYILAIPLLGYVYIRELSIRKQRAEEAIKAYGKHLEELVETRTSELTSANEQLQREIIEREQAQAKIAQRNAELALLHQVSVFLTSTLDPARIYDQITQQAAKLLGCQMAFLFLWDGERQAATSVASCGLSKSGSKFIQVQPDEHDILHDLIIHRRTISIEDGEADSQIPLSWCQECDIKALLALPLWGEGKPLGILFLIDQRGPRQWLPDEVALAESFVNLAAITLENVQLHKQVELTAALEERQRIAAEMHDGLAQMLSLIGLRTDRATGSIKTGCSQDAIQELGHVRNAVEQAAREVRRSIASLQKSPRPRQPLQDQLTEVVDKFSMLGGPPVEIINRLQDSLFLPPEHVEQALRVVQETLANVRRHAHAQRITVYLEKQDDKIIVTVKDDGRGFDPNAPLTNGGDHFGLNIMRARATRIGGRVEIDSIPGQGTQVSLTWSSRSTPQISNTSLIANSLAQEGGA